MNEKPSKVFWSHRTNFTSASAVNIYSTKIADEHMTDGPTVTIHTTAKT